MSELYDRDKKGKQMKKQEVKNMQPMNVVAWVDGGLEQVTHLDATDREVLFVMSDRLTGANIKALQSWKERLDLAGKQPFLILACHRKGETLGPKGLFDLTVICGREEDLPLSLPAETMVDMLRGDFAEFRQRELLHPGRLVCFEHSATWTGDSKEAMDGLCHALRQEMVGAQDGSPVRILACATGPYDLAWDIFMRCGEALTLKGVLDKEFLFQMHLTGRGADNRVTVRGMVGQE